MLIEVGMSVSVEVCQIAGASLGHMVAIISDQWQAMATHTPLQCSVAVLLVCAE